MTTVRQWTGHEARALRAALRLSVRAFSDRLGVAARTVSKWEAGGRSVVPRPDTQAILDTALGRAAADVQRRFELLRRPGDHLVVGAAAGEAQGDGRRRPGPSGICTVDGSVTDTEDMKRREMLRLMSVTGTLLARNHSGPAPVILRRVGA